MAISLRAARVNAEMTQKKAADVLGVGKSTIISWEKGRTAPTTVMFKKLCSIYGVKSDDIFYLKNKLKVNYRAVQ